MSTSHWMKSSKNQSGLRFTKTLVMILSLGRKMRIDLSLLFTWRDIAKMRNSADTNLLILDEIFDSSLDDGAVSLLLLSNLQYKTHMSLLFHIRQMS